MTLYVGVDPGVSGGIAMVDEQGRVVSVNPIPFTERDILEVFLPGDGAPAPTMRAVLERVSASPQMGTVSAFTFGKGYGVLLMALTAARVRFDQVTPRKWQEAMGCLSQGDKNVTKRRAQQLFPDIKVTHAIADALLLAEYCRRLEVRVPVTDLIEAAR